jgi:hypothetical protein
VAQPPGDSAFVKTTKPEAAAAVRIGAGLGRRKHAELLELLRPCFARVGPWLQAGKYAAALMSDLPRRNGWTLAERAGDRAPDRMQRLLSRAVWDAAAAMKAVRRFAVAGLDQAARPGGRRGLAVAAIDRPARSSRVSAPPGSSATISAAPGRWPTGSPRSTWPTHARARGTR